VSKAAKQGQQQTGMYHVRDAQELLTAVESCASGSNMGCLNWNRNCMCSSLVACALLQKHAVGLYHTHYIIHTVELTLVDAAIHELRAPPPPPPPDGPSRIIACRQSCEPQCHLSNSADITQSIYLCITLSICLFKQLK
jgi:hypothetical protein